MAIENNHYSQVYEFIRKIAMENLFVNVVTKGEFRTIDFDKMTTRPFVHVNTNGGALSTSIVLINVEIGAFDNRIENKEINTDKFWGNDNEVDNLNTTFSIIKEMWAKMYYAFQNNEILADELPNFEEVSDPLLKIDGVVIKFQLELPNHNLGLCN